MKKVTIIVPVYNTQQYLKECFDSIVAQTYKNIEVIIVDDGSTDNSLSICEEYESKYNNIRVIHKENGGGGSARNVALEIATGDYIIFVDSDDWILPTAAEHLVQLTEKYNADVTHCEVFKDPLKRNIVTNEQLSILNSHETMEVMLNDRIRSGEIKLYKREIVKNVCFPLDSSIDDMLFFSDLIENIKTMVVSNLPLYYYRYDRLDNMSNSTDRFVKNVYERYVEFKKRYAIGKKHGCNVEEAYKNAIIHALVFYAHYETEKDWLSERVEIEKYIKANIRHILRNHLLSKRDKLKCCLLILNKRLYKKISVSLKKGDSNAG